jgi:PAS domain S-box-containing protein
MASAEDMNEHKRAPEALGLAAKRFEFVTLATRDALYDWDLVSHEIWRNENYQRLFGAPARDRHSDNWWVDRLHPADRERVLAAQDAAFASAENLLSREYRLRRPDGSYADIVERYLIVRGAKGRVVRLIGALTDITERKRAEEALAESEERFRSLVENISVGIYRTTPDGRILMANPALVRMLGYTSFEELASRDLELEGFATGYPRRAFREQVEREGEVKDFASAWERRDGAVVFVRETARAVRASDGRVLCYDGIVEDITERSRAVKALGESEARFRAVFENAAIGIALVDMHGHPVESNPALQRMLGYNKTELAQMAFSNFTHPDDAKASRDLFAELCEGKRDRYQLEKRYYRKDGQIVWAQLTESLVRNQNGEPQYAIGMVEDITERKRASETLRQLSGRLLRLQDEERRRIARELHDTTGQSLAGLAMNLTLVKDSAPDLSPKARACLSESLELAEECSREIRTLAYLLHPPLLEEVGLGSALRWFIDGYTQRTGIEVDREIPPQLGRLSGDVELALYRVVQEGLTNIHLHSGSKKAQVSLKCRPDQAVLTISDEGRGLPPGLLERGGGLGAKLGVGISGMRERIRQLGGQFEIISGSNGTTLSAIVPLGRDQA